MTNMQQLITYTRQRSNMEANEFVTDPEIQLYLNQSLGELDDILATTYEDYNMEIYISGLPAPDGSSILPVPPNLLKLRGVDYQMQPGSTSTQPYWFTVPKFNFLQRNQLNQINVISIPWGRMNMSYNLIAQGIQITPITNSLGTYRIWFTPKFQYLTQLTDILPLRMNMQGWSEYAIVDACIKIFNKQNLDPSAFMTEKAALQQRIIAAAQNRDSGGVKTVTDVRYGNQGFAFGGSYGYFGY